MALLESFGGIMLTRIEIDGFKSFEDFGLDLRPFAAVVGPNASGKSNLFDALRFLSLLSQTDIRSAMSELRGLPEELFRRTGEGINDRMKFAVEVLLDRQGTDAFGRAYEIRAQRLRYELTLELKRDSNGLPRSVYVANERCVAMRKRDDHAQYVAKLKPNYNSNISPFIRVSEGGDALEIRQDDRQAHGRPVSLSLNEASRTALSTVTTAEFRHLYALKDALSSLRFLEINPRAARDSTDRLASRVLRPDASNLAGTLARLKEDTATVDRPDGVLSDIAADLSALIPSVCKLEVDSDDRQFSFSIGFTDKLSFSSRVISDGTLRLLALLAILDDPDRRGTLCFEEPENGVHEGRIPMLVELLRQASLNSPDGQSKPFQILVNTHSPKLMRALQDAEIIAADSVMAYDLSKTRRVVRTRMRSGVQAQQEMFDPESNLTRAEVELLLQRSADAA